MRTRFYLYFSKHKAQDQHLYRLIGKIPERQRNSKIKHILLDVLSSRSKQSKSEKPLPPTHLASHTKDQADFNPQPHYSTQTNDQEKPLTSNPLDNLQQALNKIPLKRQG